MSDTKPIFDKLVNVIQEHVAPCFKEGMKFTLLCRNPNNPDHDVFISSDDDEGIAAAVVRAAKRGIKHSTGGEG